MPTLVLIVFWSKNLYNYIMSIEQKKISLINWISTLEDEVILDQLEGIKKTSIDQLPGAIVQLIKMAEDEPNENLIKHTSAKDFLKMK